MKDPELEPCDDPAGHAWTEAETWCDVCGEHQALYCASCGATVDLVIFDDPREE